MCGIAGILYADHLRPPPPELLAAMGSAIAHRGPDGEGFFREAGIGLVHRRLAIIDLAGGGQPLGNEDGSVQVVFNGEIYNFVELRAMLEAKGHRFRTRSDTEVLVHLYEEDGERMVERLRGMFAFAIWDGKRKQLLLARDRLGIKPLYFYRDGEKLLFGSEIKALLACPGLKRSVDPAALEDYLAYGMVPGPRSIFAGIEKLQPAHTLLIRPGDWRQSPKKYWQLRFEPDAKPSLDEWKEAIQAKIAETVEAHLIADVPVGAFLSGGLDSSYIVASASGQTQGDLRTFSIGFQDANVSELPYARAVSERYQTRHVEEIVTADAVSLLDELTRFYDEPFADSSAVPTFLVSRLAARSVKVVLSGDGGDEAFGGYWRYAHDLKEAGLRRRMPGWFRRGVLAPAGAFWPKADWLPRPLRAKTLLTNLGLESGPAYANTLAVCRPPLRRTLLAPHLRAGLNGHNPGQVVCDHHATASNTDALAGMIAADVGTILPDDYLVKVDRASMANGLEVRPPLLDHELLELTARVPSDLKIRDGETKWIFKQVARDQLPRAVLERPKQGFEMPIDDWLRGPLRPIFAEAVLAPRSPVAGLIDQGRAGRVFAAHTSGRSRQGNLLWGLLVLARWSARYLQ